MHSRVSQSAGTRWQHCGHPAAGGDGFLCDVKRFRAVDAAVVKRLLDGQPQGEGADMQRVQQRGFAGAHLVSGLNQLHIAQHFSAAPGGRSGDARSLEEGHLLGPQTSVLGRRCDFAWPYGASTGGSWHLPPAAWP